MNVDCRHDLYRLVMYSIETASLRRAHQPTRLPESRIVVAQPRARRRTAPQSGRNSCVGLPSIRLHEEACGSIQAPADRYLPPQGMP